MHVRTVMEVKEHEYVGFLVFTQFLHGFFIFQGKKQIEKYAFVWTVESVFCDFLCVIPNKKSKNKTMLKKQANES